jgi:hypothetical protein
MKANTPRNQFKYVRRGTPVPAWLQGHWKKIPGAPRADTIEGRALLLMRMHRDEARWLKSRPKLLQALAWDLMEASLSECRTPPEPVKWLVQLALGLPKQLTAGDWTPSELDNRGFRKGGTDREALSVARLVEWLYEKEYGKQIGPGPLAKELKLLGFDVPKPTIRKWRQNKVPTPGPGWFPGDDDGEISREIVSRWRAVERKRPGTKAGP